MESVIVKEQKIKGITSKVIGVINALLLVAVLLLRFLGYMENQYIFALMVLLFSGILFSLNAAVFNIKASSAIAKLNIFISFIFLLATLLLLVYGIVIKEIVFF